MGPHGVKANALQVHGGGPCSKSGPQGNIYLALFANCVTPNEFPKK